MSQHRTIMKREHSGLAWKFHVNPESCHDPFYFESYLQLSAFGDYIKGMSTTHLLIDRNDDTGEERIMGFVSLRATSFIEDSFSDDGNRIVVGIPSLEIYELAVDKDYERRGVGSDLVGIAFDKAADLRKEIGIRRVVLCAAEEAVGFYKKEPLKFNKIDDYYCIPRDNTNQSCISMFKILPEL